MQFEQQPFIYFGSAVLFLLPCSLLYFACKRLFQPQVFLSLPAWRKYFVRAALWTSGLATSLHIVWNASWLHSGGSPHGMGAGPGIWRPLGPILAWTFLAATILNLFGKGKGRVLLVGWSLSMYFVFQMIYVLQFD
jgi:hypothetical protein